MNERQDVLVRFLGALGSADADELFAEDAVIETPFAAPGQPRRFAGRAAFLSYATPRRAAVPIRLTGPRHLVVHQTTDPEVLVAEYELGGSLPDGRTGSAAFIAVARIRDGRITHWREYQDTRALAATRG